MSETKTLNVRLTKYQFNKLKKLKEQYAQKYYEGLALSWEDFLMAIELNQLK